MAEIVKGKIGNALTSTAADHVVAVADDIFDEQLEKYQSILNALMAVLDENGDAQENPFHVISNNEYIKAVVDSESKLLFGIKADGKPYFPKNDMYHVVQNEEFLYAVVDAENKLLIGIRRDGEIIEGKIPLKTRAELENLRVEAEENIGALREELSRNVLAVEMDRTTGQIIGYTGNDSRIKSCVQDRVTGIITINQVIE